LPRTLTVNLPKVRTLFGPNSALLNNDLHKVLEGTDPRAAAETIVQQSQLALLDAARQPDQIPFLENEVMDENLDGEVWESQIFDESTDQSDDDSQGKGVPPWKTPLTGDFADALRERDEKEGASDDLALSDVDPENVDASAAWLGQEDEAIPPALMLMLEPDWERCSTFSRSTGASFIKVSDSDLAAGVEDEEMPAASTASAAAGSDAALL